MEVGFHQLRRGGTLALVGAGIDHPAFDPNRFILNELHVVGSFIYDKGGFEQALELLASDGFPNDLLIEAEDVPLDGISDALVGLAEGRYAGKVMVVPRLSDGAVHPATGGGRDGPPLLPDRQPAVQPRGHEPRRRPARRGQPQPTSAASGARSSGSTRSRS